MLVYQRVKSGSSGPKGAVCREWCKHLRHVGVRCLPLVSGQRSSPVDEMDGAYRLSVIAWPPILTFWSPSLSLPMTLGDFSSKYIVDLRLTKPVTTHAASPLLHFYSWQNLAIPYYHWTFMFCVLPCSCCQESAYLILFIYTHIVFPGVLRTSPLPPSEWRCTSFLPRKPGVRCWLFRASLS